jgi:hypothetical protein
MQKINTELFWIKGEIAPLSPKALFQHNINSKS